MARKPDRDPLRFLVVIAHPHDFTHCSGTCGIHRQMGDSVTVVVMTDGGRKHNEAFMDELRKPEAERDPEIMKQTPETYAAQKAEEFQKVCALFDVTDIRILPFPEPFRLSRSPEAVEALEDIIPRCQTSRHDHPLARHRLASRNLQPRSGCRHHQRSSRNGRRRARSSRQAGLDPRLRKSKTGAHHRRHLLPRCRRLARSCRFLRRHLQVAGATVPG